MTTSATDGVPAGRFQEVRSSTDIDAPVDVVWDVVHDPDAFVAAIGWVYEVWTDDDEPLGPGSVYFERGKPGFREGTYRWEITEYEDGRRSVHVHESGEFVARLEVRTEPVDGDRTRYTQVMHFRAMPAFRPLGYLLERTVMKRSMQRDFDEMILPNFKLIAERRELEA